MEYVDVVEEFVVLRGLDDLSVCRAGVLALDLSEGESIALDERMLGFFRRFFVASLRPSFRWFFGVGLSVALKVASPFFFLIFRR